MTATRTPTRREWMAAFRAWALERDQGIHHGPAAEAFVAIDDAYLASRRTA